MDQARSFGRIWLSDLVGVFNLWGRAQWDPLPMHLDVSGVMPIDLEIGFCVDC